MSSDLGPILSAAYPQVVATLIRVLGDIDRAMDATQDALIKAMKVWGAEGVPDNPVAWLVTVGRNGAVDQLRRDRRSISIDSNVVALPGAETVSVDADVETLDWVEVDDDLLRLLFTCCHPDLKPNSQVVLMLKVVLGFSIEEIARALLASPASIEKRLTRAKQKLKGEAYEVPAVKDIPERLDAVMQAIYLVFNEGYTRIQDARLERGSLIEVAIRLGRIVSRLFRHHPDPRSLLALMLLTAARLPARLDSAGTFVPLDRQDRSLWRRDMINEGVALIDAVYAARHLPSAYQIQAAISAIHSGTERASDTDWVQIAALYGKLEEYDASPAVCVNRAVALSRCGEIAAALRELEDPTLARRMERYQPYFAALGLCYKLAGDSAGARGAIERAIALSDSAAQRAHLKQELLDL